MKSIKLKYDTNFQTKYLLLFIQIIIAINLITISNASKNINTIKVTKSLNENSIKNFKEENKFTIKKTINANLNKKSDLSNKENISNTKSQIKNYNKIKKPKSQLSKYKKLLKKKYNEMKKKIKKNGRGIKKCGLDFLTEVYCQFYKKNYNEGLKKCRKLKQPDFKRNCSNLKSIYVLFFVKSALNTFSDFNKTSIKSEANARKIYKTILNRLIKPFRNCSEIPNEIKLNMIKKESRIIYNKKQIKKLSTNEKNYYKKLFKNVKMIFSLLRSDLIAIDPGQDKIKCVGIINAGKTIVKYFSNMKTLKEKKKN
jgi:hypothetical protein